MQKQSTGKKKPRTVEQMQSKLIKDANAALDKLPPKPMRPDEIVRSNIALVRDVLNGGLSLTTIAELITGAFGVSVSTRAIKRVLNEVDNNPTSLSHASTQVESPAAGYSDGHGLGEHGGDGS